MWASGSSMAECCLLLVGRVLLLAFATLSHAAGTLPKERLLFKVGKYLSVERLVYVYTFKCLRDAQLFIKLLILHSY